MKTCYLAVKQPHKSLYLKSSVKLKEELFKQALTITFLLVTVVCIGIVLFISGPVFQLKTVYVRSTADIFPDKSVFQVHVNVIFFPTAELAEKVVDASPFIKNVYITKSYPSSLIIDVEERSPVAIFHPEGGRMFVDDEGRVLPEIDSFTKFTLPVLTCSVEIDRQNRIADQKLKTALQVAHDLLQSGEVRLTEIGCDSDMKTIIMLIDGVPVRMLPDKGSQTLSPTLLFLFKQFRIEGRRPQSVDLRFEKPVLTP